MNTATLPRNIGRTPPAVRHPTRAGLSVVQGKVERRNVSVLMLETDDVTEALRWDLINAWPSEWRGAPLDALGREVAIESMTLVFESLQRA